MIWLHIEVLGLKSFFTLVEEPHNYFICVQFYFTVLDKSLLLWKHSRCSDHPVTSVSSVNHIAFRVKVYLFPFFKCLAMLQSTLNSQWCLLKFQCNSDRLLVAALFAHFSPYLSAIRPLLEVTLLPLQLYSSVFLVTGMNPFWLTVCLLTLWALQGTVLFVFIFLRIFHNTRHRVCVQ